MEGKEVDSLKGYPHSQFNLASICAELSIIHAPMRECLRHAGNFRYGQKIEFPYPVYCRARPCLLLPPVHFPRSFLLRSFTIMNFRNLLCLSSFIAVSAGTTPHQHRSPSHRNVAKKMDLNTTNFELQKRFGNARMTWFEPAT